MRKAVRCLSFLTCIASPLAMAEPVPPQFAGRMLVVASDGDMQASAYQGDALGPPRGDLLSVIRLDRPLNALSAKQLVVPNSVVGPPSALALTPDGRYAIIAETRGSSPKGRPDSKLVDLPPGRMLTVVDLRVPNRPRLVQKLKGRPNPISVTVSADGRLVVVAHETKAIDQPPLVVYRLVGGRLTAPETPLVPGFEVGDTIRNATFDRASGRLGVVYASRPRLSLLRLDDLPSGIAFLPAGNDVPVGRTPFMVRFTTDGRFAIVNDMDVPTQGEDVRGTVTSIAIGEPNAATGDPVNRIVSTARTGVMPEGMALSPDDRYIVTTNLERTAYSPQDPRQGHFASVTLIKLDARSGSLARVDDYPFAGVLPEAVVFDNDSRYIAVASFDRPFVGIGTGAIDIWRIAGDFQDPDRVVLAPTGHSMRLPRGAQSMVIAR